MFIQAPPAAAFFFAQPVMAIRAGEVMKTG
jgi:hypothetical protein